MKKCTRCNTEKPFSEFYKDKRRKGGLRHHCKSCWKEDVKEYVESNKEKVKERAKRYRENNIEHKRKYDEKYIKNNKERIREYHKRNNSKRRNRVKQRKITDPFYKMRCNLRSRTYMAFKLQGYSKDTKTQEMLGVDWEVCKAHIERQFTKGMNWDNYGEWHIDHIIPLSFANNEVELKKLCHYSNLQPLWAEENLSKKDKITGQQNKLRL